jgi:hypothetical protein
MNWLVERFVDWLEAAVGHDRAAPSARPTAGPQTARRGARGSDHRLDFQVFGPECRAIHTSVQGTYRCVALGVWHGDHGALASTLGAAEGYEAHAQHPRRCSITYACYAQAGD